MIQKMIGPKSRSNAQGHRALVTEGFCRVKEELSEGDLSNRGAAQQEHALDAAIAAHYERGPRKVGFRLTKASKSAAARVMRDC